MTQCDLVHFLENVLTVKQNISINLTIFHQIIHTVQCLQKCRFSTSGRSDKCSDLIRLDLHIHIFECMEVSIMKIQMADIKFIILCFLLPFLLIILSTCQSTK